MTSAVALLGCALLCAAAALALTHPALAGSLLAHRDAADTSPAPARRRVAATLLLVAALLTASGLLGLLDGHGPATAQQAGIALTSGLALPAVVLAYPRGLPTPVDRVAAVLAAGCGLAVVVGSLGGPAVALAAGGWVLTGLLLAVVWWRTERSSGLERTRLLWLAVGAVAPGLAVGQVLFALDEGPADAAVLALLVGAAAALAALVLGLLAPRLVDVRRLISQCARYTVSVELALAVFAGTEALVLAVRGAAMGSTSTAVLVLVVAAGFHPVSLVVQRLFDELLFGRRTDPVAVMSSLSDQLRIGSTPREWVDALRDGLGVARVELWDTEQRLAAAVGHAEPGAGPERTVSVDLAVGREVVGALVVALGPGDEGEARGVRSVLDLVAPPLARAVHGLRLTAELAAERAQALGALEEERRRLRRDLHDGLGPVLTGIAYSADAVRNLVRSDPDEAVALLALLRQDTAGSIAEVRRLVVGLRPPALDELGLVAAVRQQVARWRCADGAPLWVDVEESGLPPTLPAAAEVAAYRVAVEAVTNAARHARPPTASGLRVTVCFEGGAGGLALTVSDDGTTGDEPWRPGVGTASMRERCEALHGTLVAGPTPGGGRVRALLPLAVARP